MISKKILTIVSFLIIFFSFIVKVYSIEPDVFVQSTVNRAAKTLGANLTKEEMGQTKTVNSYSNTITKGHNSVWRASLRHR